MGKKRINQLAKELGYSNQDLVSKLQKLGFDVKTHASSVEEEDVLRALKPAGSRSTRGDGRGRVIRRRGGGVIRRKAPEAPKPTESATPPVVEAAAPPEAPVAPPPPVSEPVVAAEPAPEPQAAEPTPPVSEPVAAESPVAAVAQPEPATEPDPKEAPAPAAEDEAKPAEAKPEAAEAAPAEEAPSEDAEDEESSQGRRKKDRRPTARPKTSKKVEEEFDEEDEKPTVDDFGISEADFSVPKEDKDSVRVAPPPPSADPVVEKKVASRPKITGRIDPKKLQERLKQSRRPEPPKSWGKQEVAPSPVIEFEVRTDAAGKRKELVDVRKDGGRGKGRSPGRNRREEMSAKELLESKQGKIYYPPTPRRKGPRPKKRRAEQQQQVAPVAKRAIQIGDTITVGELSQQMSLKVGDIIGFLMRNRIMATINQPISHEIALMICEHFDYEVDARILVEEELLSGQSLEEAQTGEDAGAEPRAPVVTVMGHVDHGKTSLLDRIRSTNVVSGEAGGITQSIAGYQVPTSRGMITFLDTPGHAAFTAMRARGANITDIVILVVAADDGVMPQTREAIDHSKAAGVPIIVAVNKIDKPEANPDRVLQQLADLGLLVEDWGGDVLCKRISAKTGEGVEELLELLALQSEIMELKANPDAPAVATVVEGHVHRGRGPVATVLVRQGTMRQGDIIVVGENIGRVRALMSDQGKRLKEAGPAVPVELLGLDGVPNPGEEVRVATSLDAAKSLAAHRRDKRRSSEVVIQGKMSLDDLFARIKAGEQKELKLIIKADVQGSVEALRDSLTKLSTPKVKVNVIHGGVGGVTESDVEFARASEAIIVGFAVRPDTNALKSARALDVDIRTYNIIYEAVDEVKLAMQGLLAPVEKEKYLGRAEVRQTFSVPKVGTVAGCAIVDGVVTRNANVRLLRDSKPLYDGKLSSLKRFKDDVREVREGFECGMGIERFNDIKEGDIIEAYEIVMTEATLDDA